MLELLFIVKELPDIVNCSSVVEVMFTEVPMVIPKPVRSIEEADEDRSPLTRI